MTLLTQPLRQLLVESGLMAVNHGLYPQARVVLDALPLLTSDNQARDILAATLLIGLGNHASAAQQLQDNVSSEAELLRRLLNSHAGAADPGYVQPSFSGVMHYGN